MLRKQVTHGTFLGTCHGSYREAQLGFGVAWGEWGLCLSHGTAPQMVVNRKKHDCLKIELLLPTHPKPSLSNPACLLGAQSRVLLEFPPVMGGSLPPKEAKRHSLSFPGRGNREGS